MYKISHFRKILNIESNKPYGVVIVYFGSKNSFKRCGPMELEKYIALTTLLDSDSVAYNPNEKVFTTDIENIQLLEAPEEEIA